MLSGPASIASLTPLCQGPRMRAIQLKRSSVGE